MSTMKRITWLELNDILREADEGTCARLLKEEQRRKSPRIEYLRRIYSRLNRVRADRERKELV
jgi:hypothetical protein